MVHVGRGELGIIRNVDILNALVWVGYHLLNVVSKVRLYLVHGEVIRGKQVCNQGWFLE